MKNRNKKYILLVSFLFVATMVLGGCGEEAKDLQSSSQTKEDGGQKQTLDVLHVVDGDTFSVWMNDKIEMVRVIGIDSPETGKKYRQKECFGKESTKRAIDILGGERVSLEADPTQADRDQYDRLLRHVFLEDGTNYGLKMIEEGFAEEMTFKGKQYEHQEEFLSAQERAKKEKQGLWGACKDK